MKMKTIFLIINLSVFFDICIHAQDYRPGYILTKNYDTIRGHIMFRDVNLAKICTFRRNPEEKLTNYSPSDIPAFRFDDGKYYVSKKVLINNDSTNVFLEYLIKGKANIYYFRDYADHYFIEKENDQLVELTEEEKVFRDDFGKSFIKPNLYQGKLKAVLSDCKDIFPQIENTSLSHSSLIKLAKDYHHKVCTTEDCMVFETRIKKSYLNYGLHGGIFSNSLRFGSQLTSDPRSSVFIGGRIELENLFKFSERISLVCEINYQAFSRYELTENYQDEITYNGKRYQLTKWDISKISADLKTTTIKIPVFVSYSFLNGKFRPFAGLGMSNQLVLKQNKDFVLKRFYTEYKQSIPFYQFGFCGKAGIKISVMNRSFLYCEFGYESVQNYNINEYLRFSEKMLSVVTGFSF